ncbi:protein of unknown function [Pseudomonas marincola]|uniref:Uncharacterized protein n=1 Tax=Pseudomonas marincola TaxID=437900 RepID=A0A8S2BHW0_9PSED|nr:protein of unknown function [Pseudomonas marincola]
MFNAMGIQDSAMGEGWQVDKNAQPVDKAVGYRGVTIAKPRCCWDCCQFAVRRSRRRFFLVTF